MAKTKRKKAPKTVLKLPDLEQSTTGYAQTVAIFSASVQDLPKWVTMPVLKRKMFWRSFTRLENKVRR